MSYRLSDWQASAHAWMADQGENGDFAHAAPRAGAFTG